MVSCPLFVQHIFLSLVGCYPEHFLTADLIVAYFRVGTLGSHLFLTIALGVFKIHIVHHLRSDRLKVLIVVTRSVNCV